MTDAQRRKLRRKYTPDKCKAIRSLFEKDVQDWQSVLFQIDLDLQCISVDKGDGTVAGPWPIREWELRTRGQYKRPCLHENVLTQYINQVVNQIELNPMGVEAQPLGEGADEKTAEFLEGRIRAIEYENQAQIAYVKAAENAVSCSVGYIKFETKGRGDGTQKICIEEIQDPKTVVPGFFKKAAGADLRRCWELERMSQEEFRHRYPKAQIKSFESYTDIGQWIDNENRTVQVAAWWHLEEDERESLKINTPEGQIQAYADELDNDAIPGEVVERKTETHRRVLKTIFNGVEALDETEWIDPGDGDAYPPEIPILIVTGRIRYEKGIRVIDSLVRNGRTGQLIHDYVISQIQEVCAITPRTTRLGAEGQFDTATNWDPKSITPYKEYKMIVDPETGAPAPPPILEQFDPRGLPYLDQIKQSNLIDIQNAIGMASTERKDRSAKSGKALEQMKEDLTVGTAHYFGSLRVAQERGYRILQRIMPILDREQSEVAIRDKFGKHRATQPLYRGSHVIAVGAGKLYQTLQEKQEETAEELMQIGDPNILLAVLPGAIKMRGIGQYGDELARMIESIQPPQMQAAREGKDIPPEAMQAVQQAQEAIRGLNAYIKELEQKIIELEETIDAKKVESASRERIAFQDNKTKILLQRMKDKAEMQLRRLELAIEQLRLKSAMATKGAELDSKETMQARELESAQSMQSQEFAHASSESQADRDAAATEGEADREAAEKQAKLSKKESSE